MAGWKCSNSKKSLLILTVITLFLAVKVFEHLKGKSEEIKKWREGPSISSKTTPPKEKRGIVKIFHLDLKGAPPKMSYLLEILPVISESGAGGILIEYEDMFPFAGPLRNISAINSYSLDEIKKLIELAESLKMEVIPLVQSFGHLEYVLKLEEFQDLRELQSFPQEICPSKKASVTLVKELIRQVMTVHVNSKYIHIGCDEVRHIGACPVCSRTSHKKIFSRHVAKIASYVRSQYPRVTPLVWDDMLREWSYDEITRSGLGSFVEPVVWAYGSNIFFLVPRYVWSIYRRIFPNVWAASAFKGAYGEAESVPNLTRHLDNNLSWMKVLKEGEQTEMESQAFAGIFLTGWSRYDHFAVLCELLPVGVPSLILNLIFLDDNHVRRNETSFSIWLKRLRCPEELINSGDFGLTDGRITIHQKLGECSFPGSNLYSLIVQFTQIKNRVRKVVKKVESGGWTSTYNVEKNFTSPWRILNMFPDEGFAGGILKKEIHHLKSNLLSTMTQYFDDHTITEWLEQNLFPLENTLKNIQLLFGKLITRRTWPRRPLS